MWLTYNSKDRSAAYPKDESDCSTDIRKELSCFIFNMFLMGYSL